MAEHIKGLKDYGELIAKEDEKLRNGKPLTDRNLPFLDFRQFPLAGAEAIDDHTLRIRLDGKYPQFKYWLTMTFFAPVPWEVDKFYAQPGMAERNLSMNYWPVGTGPYMLTEYQENRRHVLSRNPNFRGEPYPVRRRGRGQGSGAARRLRQADALHRQGRFLHREGTNPAQDQVPAGLLRQPGDLALRLVAGPGLRRQELRKGGAAIP